MEVPTLVRCRAKTDGTPSIGSQLSTETPKTSRRILLIGAMTSSFYCSGRQLTAKPSG